MCLLSCGYPQGQTPTLHHFDTTALPYGDRGADAVWMDLGELRVDSGQSHLALHRLSPLQRARVNNTYLPRRPVSHKQQLMQVQQYNFRPSPHPYPGVNQGPSAHINNSHPRSIVTHRSTKASALAEQGEQLLQGLRVTSPIETLLARTTAN